MMGKRAESGWLPALPPAEEEANLTKVHETVTDLIKQVANEPSVGLYYVQQHVHKAVPALVTLTGQLAEITQEAEFDTEDAKDALNSVKSMKECGPSTIERMIKALSSSASILPSVQVGRSSGRTVKIRASADDEQQTAVGQTAVVESSSEPVEPSRSPGNSLLAASLTTGSPSTDKHGTVWTVLDSAMSTASNVTTGVRMFTLAKSSRDGESTLDKPAGGYVRSVLGSALQRATSLGYSSPAGPDHAEASSSSGRASQSPAYALPSRYFRAVYDSAVQTTRDGTRFFREQTIVINQDMQSASGLAPEDEINAEDTGLPSEPHPDLDSSSFEKFQAEQAAQLEAWLEDTETSPP